MTADVVISTAGAMPGDGRQRAGRQRAEEQTFKNDKIKPLNHLVMKHLLLILLRASLYLNQFLISTRNTLPRNNNRHIQSFF